LCIIFAGCSSNFIHSDKFEGVWVSDNALFYDHQNYRWDTFSTSELPKNIFVNRNIGIIKIQKNSENYDVVVATYTFTGVDSNSSNYANEIQIIKKNSDNILDKLKYSTSATVNGDVLNYVDEDVFTIKGNINENGKNQSVEYRVREHYTFKYDSSTNYLNVTEHYYETIEGKRIDLQPNDRNNIFRHFKKYSKDDFYKFCNDVLDKSFKEAKEMDGES
jgi:hypothetical protein